MNDVLQDLLTFTQKQNDNNKPKAKYNAFIISHNPCTGNQVTIADKLKQHKENEIIMKRSLEKFLPKKKDKIDLDWVDKNNVIVHYLGTNKPWKKNYRGILKGYYTRYAEK